MRWVPCGTACSPASVAASAGVASADTSAAPATQPGERAPIEAPRGRTFGCRRPRGAAPSPQRQPAGQRHHDDEHGCRGERSRRDIRVPCRTRHDQRPRPREGCSGHAEHDGRSDLAPGPKRRDAPAQGGDAEPRQDEPHRSLGTAGQRQQHQPGAERREHGPAARRGRQCLHGGPYAVATRAERSNPSATPSSTIALARCRKWSAVFSARMFAGVPTRKNPTIPSSR